MSTTETDPSVVELTLQLSGLQVTVRGPLDRASRFVQQVSDLQRGPPSTPRASSGASPGLRENGSATPSTVGQARTPFSETRASILASFPDCPEHLLQLACARLGGPRQHCEVRAARAWVAGNWARAVVEGRVSSPNRTPTIDLRNRFWAVVRCSRCRAPRIFTSSAAYHRALGPLEDSDSLSQAFPSETEARIYLEAAGVEVEELD